MLVNGIEDCIGQLSGLALVAPLDRNLHIAEPATAPDYDVTVGTLE